MYPTGLPSSMARCDLAQLTFSSWMKKLALQGKVNDARSISITPARSEDSIGLKLRPAAGGGKSRAAPPWGWAGNRSVSTLCLEMLTPRRDGRLLEEQDFQQLVGEAVGKAPDPLLERDHRGEFRRESSDAAGNFPYPFVRNPSLDDEPAVFQYKVVVVIGHLVGELRPGREADVGHPGGKFHPQEIGVAPILNRIDVAVAPLALELDRKSVV